MTDLNALQRAAAHHIQRGDHMVMDAATILGLVNGILLAKNALKIVASTPDLKVAVMAAEDALKHLERE